MAVALGNVPERQGRLGEPIRHHNHLMMSTSIDGRCNRSILLSAALVMFLPSPLCGAQALVIDSFLTDVPVAYRLNPNAATGGLQGGPNLFAPLSEFTAAGGDVQSIDSIGLSLSQSHGADTLLVSFEAVVTPEPFFSLCLVVAGCTFCAPPEEPCVPRSVNLA